MCSQEIYLPPPLLCTLDGQLPSVLLLELGAHQPTAKEAAPVLSFNLHNFRGTPCFQFILSATRDRMLDLPLEDLTSGLEDEARLKHCGTEAPHDAQTMYLSLFLCVGVVVSYLPQHIRIIKK